MRNTNKDDLGKLLCSLSPIQRKAVDWDEGALLVLAGPGSGKTRVLTCRIARLLEESRGRTFRILGLTFTNKAADEMRDRIRGLLPDMEQRLFLGTFHSFCADVLRQHGGHVGIKPDFRIYSSDEDLSGILADALKEARLLDSEVSGRDDALLPVISRLKSELVPPSEAAARIRDESLRKRIGTIYQCYEDQLAKRNALDFNSLIYYACELFRKYPAFAKRYRTVYAYWCFDEFQDTNSSQYALIKAMAGDSFRNIFVVADDDQIIYQWNGASHKRLENYRNDFQPAVLQLPTNYRCPPPIVELANRLIEHNLLRTPGKQPLESVYKECIANGEVVHVHSFRSDNEEAEWIAGDISSQHRGHLSDVVVLARNRRLLELVKSKLSRHRITAVIAQRRDDFASAPYIWLHACLKQCNDLRNSRNFETLAGAFQSLTSFEVDVASVIANAKAHHGDYLREWAETLRASAQDDAVRRVGVEVLNRLVHAADFQGFISFAQRWIETLSTASDEGDTERFSGYGEDKRAWAELYRDIQAALAGQSTLESFLHELELRSKEPSLRSDCIPLMTIHAAKGKEYEHVYVMGLAEEQMPSYQSVVKGPNCPEMEEERRNCFVAITRAKSTLTLTYAMQYSGWPKQPSRFLQEMGLCVVYE